MPIPARRTDLTLPQQLVLLRAGPASRGTGGITRRELTWRYDAVPSPISRTYGLRLTYRAPGTPHVLVDTPDIVALAGGRPLPHVYGESPVRLCLYLPGSGEWDASMPLDRTVVPWSVLWLWHFEDWLSTGEWGGGGVHPGEVAADAEPPRARARRRLQGRVGRARRARASGE